MSLRSVPPPVDWWLTRRMLLAWVSAWLAQLQAVDLPPVAGLSLARDLGTEHRLSLEFDGPVTTPPEPESEPDPHNSKPPKTWLLHEVTITVQPTGCVVLLKAKNQEMALQLDLTRKEAHAVLEMLALKARNVGWLEKPLWPDWLGE